MAAPSFTYLERLVTFAGFWDDDQATALQLAAIGHVYDRPPLEALEEGSRCIECSQFVRRDLSVRALGGSISASPSLGSYRDGFENFSFHREKCDRLQIRIPLDPQAVLPGLYGGYRISDMRARFEARPASNKDVIPGTKRPQTSSLFSLPTELRLEIYAMILPRLPKVTTIVPLNRDSARIVTSLGYSKAGPRDMTKSNLLRSCQAIHSEALDLLYSNVSYTFSSTKVMYLFLRHIGHAGRSLLKSVDITCGQREDAVTFALLASCEKLRSITIRLARPRILYPRAPLWVAEGVACVLALRGLTEVNFADCGPEVKLWMRESEPDAEIIRRQLMRDRNSTEEEDVNGWVMV